jgi:superfamily I DNA and/or RNA helicase
MWSLATHGGIGAVAGLRTVRFGVFGRGQPGHGTPFVDPDSVGGKNGHGRGPSAIAAHHPFPEAAERGLKITLMERLQPNLPENLQTLLRVQYRMNEQIMGFSSAQFYDNKLVAHASVKDHSLLDIPHVSPTG